MKRLSKYQLHTLATFIAFSGLAFSISAFGQYTPQFGHCSGLVIQQGNPDPSGSFPAELISSAPNNTEAICTWHNFVNSSYILPNALTLTMDVGGTVFGPGSIGRINVTFSGGGGNYDLSSNQDLFSVTIPAGTDLYTLSVVAIARAGNQQRCDPQSGTCATSEAELDVYDMQVS